MTTHNAKAKQLTSDMWDLARWWYCRR